ncbi:hypothetical protein P153DRAFT_360718 [Dothidotthia symphoricarpi CBS 119687]|uniref:DUF6594 domain-containing protein n=1 Tax=Dothidotthia symphoricarpi CBS 119687 TaxID=1392245 RepID=A0A6A5ZZE5_9PLEO|nr:uncharacterized protein P153DRAFT_360718 [Dothidotthia symphoricarpi CBS 119687]KAF2125112.1 hypothetical protein P153DRAFT_360718 [Dothidotthia symphoricarpi CBS 119687]
MVPVATLSANRNNDDLEKQLSNNRPTALTNSTLECLETTSTLTKEQKKMAALEAAEEINHTITIPRKTHTHRLEPGLSLNQRSVQDYPVGYPLQAAFQSSEPGFSIYRAFDYLHSRVILEMQDELRCLEDNLSQLDAEDNNSRRNKCLMSRASDEKQAKRDNKPCSDRTTLLSTIRDKLVSYDEVLMKARELNAFQRPSKRDYRSLRRWFRSKAPLNYEREEEFIKRKEDLITLRQGREWAGFDGWIEECINKLPSRLSKYLFTTPELRKKSDDPLMSFYSISRIEKLASLIITSVIFILLVLPVVAMYKPTSVGGRNSTFDAVGILVVFTLLFSAAMSLLTMAKRHELFAASAAYCAVLVVFISNFSNEGGKG